MPAQGLLSCQARREFGWGSLSIHGVQAAALSVVCRSFHAAWRQTQEWSSWDTVHAACTDALRLPTAQAKLQHVCQALVDARLVNHASVCLVANGCMGLGAISGPAIDLFPPLLQPLDSLAEPSGSRRQSFSMFIKRNYFKVDGSGWSVEEVVKTGCPALCQDLTGHPLTGQTVEGAWLAQCGMSSMICLPIEHEGSICGVLLLGLHDQLGAPSNFSQLQRLTYHITPFVVQSNIDLQSVLNMTTPHRFKSLSEITSGLVDELINLDRILASRISSSRPPYVTKAHRQLQCDDKASQHQHDPENYKVGAAWAPSASHGGDTHYPQQIDYPPPSPQQPGLSPAQQTAAAYLSLVLGTDTPPASIVYMDAESKQVVASVAKFNRQTRHSVLSLDQYSGSSSHRSSMCPSITQHPLLVNDSSAPATDGPFMMPGPVDRFCAPLSEEARMRDPPAFDTAGQAAFDDGLSMIMRLQGSAAYTAARMFEPEDPMSPSSSPSDCTARQLEAGFSAQSFKRRISFATSGRPSCAVDALTSCSTSDMLDMLHTTGASCNSARPSLHHQHCRLLSRVESGRGGGFSSSGRPPSQKSSFGWSREPREHQPSTGGSPAQEVGAADPSFVYSSCLYAPSSVYASTGNARHSQEMLLPCLPEDFEMAE